METFFEAVGWFSLILLILIGLGAGYIASIISGGRNRVKYMVIGVLGALMAPLIAALLGVGLLAAGGVLIVLVLALVGAVVLVGLAKIIFD
ncbi:MAG: GlsB/YeaQ/YmgE family stress response membrane protein [Celeribacter sp.]|jgi:uncharacterized membrane protein YeaQ/YmgE (transglycosylase-associated protein family)